MKAVFTSKAEPGYDDLPEFWYHFPATYLRQAEAAVGDWVVYYEPRRLSDDPSSRGGRSSYTATARVTGIRRDPQLQDHFYADVADYLEFDRPVPFRDGARFYESALMRADGETSKGAFGRSVRGLPDDEYEGIVSAGFAILIDPVVRTRRTDLVLPPGFAEEEPALFERPIVERISRRPFREAAFSVAVKAAYDDTCAMTGLKIINGGGRSEVQAAHIRPVAKQGPDSLRNGIALSGTAHWMFDRGLVSIGEDYSILVAKNLLPPPVQRLLRPEGRIRLPGRPEVRPHPQFLTFHRENIFKG